MTDQSMELMHELLKQLNKNHSELIQGQDLINARLKRIKQSLFLDN